MIRPVRALRKSRLTVELWMSAASASCLVATSAIVTRVNGRLWILEGGNCLSLGILTLLAVTSLPPRRRALGFMASLTEDCR